MGDISVKSYHHYMITFRSVFLLLTCTSISIMSSEVTHILPAPPHTHTHKTPCFVTTATPERVQYIIYCLENRQSFV